MDGLTVLDYVAGYTMLAVMVLPLLYGLYLEYRREHEERKRS